MGFSWHILDQARFEHLATAIVLYVELHLQGSKTCIVYYIIINNLWSFSKDGLAFQRENTLFEKQLKAFSQGSGESE